MENKIQDKIKDFPSLLAEYNIEIPIIQRDYAQGRIDKKEIRENFLMSLFNTLKNDIPIKLDFIYGSIVNGNFQPLDGQQRLTTLFLLYWYIGYKENQLTENVKIWLSKFSYETRITSREFCHALINKELIITEQMSIKESIINSNWFYLSWLQDPTIDSMLRTIEHIDIIFSSSENLWKKLNNSNSIISFYFVELEKLGLTDDLYIKMNARGKQLTAFENFKAGLQKRINEEYWDIQKELKDTFGVKIDNDWNDYFWSHFRNHDSIDTALLRFIAAINMISQSAERNITIADERATLLNQLQEDPKSIRPKNFTQNGYNFLYNCFEIYMDQIVLLEYLNLKILFPMWRHRIEGSIFKEIVYNENRNSTINKESASYTQKALLYAEILYLEKVREIKDNYYDWIRVVRNIVSRADIDREGNRPDIIRSPQSFDSAINLLKEISVGCEDIYLFLSNNPKIKSQFAKLQISEEIHKAQLILKDEANKKILFDAEDNELLRGKLNFLFYILDYNKDIESFNQKEFKKVSIVFNKYFKDESSLNNDLRRAFLTVEVNNKYEFYNYWWSFWHIGNANKRRLFDKFRELEYYLESDFKEYFKKVVLKLQSSDLIEIAKEFQPPQNFPNWKLRLIKEKSILDESKTNYIAIPEDEEFCYLLKSKRPREIEGNFKIQ